MSRSKPLSNEERKRLRRIGHLLNPVVMLGTQGLSDNVIEEARRALEDHELIKVRVSGEDRDLRTSLIQSLLEATGAELIQNIGKIILIYKLADKRNMHLSNIARYSHLDD